MQLDTEPQLLSWQRPHGKILNVLNCNPLISNFKPVHKKKFLSWDKCLVKVQCQGRSAILFAVVSKGNRQNLLGRTWIDALKFDLNEIYYMNQVHNNHGALDSFLRCHSTIFQDGLGHCHKVKVHLTLKPDAQPKFCKSQLLLFSIKPVVEQDLERQVHNGMLQRVEYSEWATPIVVVPSHPKPFEFVVISA